MVRLVTVIIIGVVIVIAGLIIIIEPFNGPDSDVTSPPLPPRSKRVSINAIPWARVFIRLPQGNNFIAPRLEHFTIRPEPNRKNANVTPIRGSLKVPVGTAIKLVCRGKEKIFPYEAWKDGKTISYDFLNQ